MQHQQLKHTVVPFTPVQSTLPSIEVYERIICAILFAVYDSMSRKLKSKSIEAIKDSVSKLSSRQQALVKWALNTQGSRLAKIYRVPNEIITNLIGGFSKQIIHRTTPNELGSALGPLIILMLNHELLSQSTVNVLAGLHDEMNIIQIHASHPLLLDIMQYQRSKFRTTMIQNVTLGTPGNRWDVSKNYSNIAHGLRSEFQQDYNSLELILNQMLDPSTDPMDWFIQHLLHGNINRRVTMDVDMFTDILHQYVQLKNRSKRVLNYLREFIQQAINDYDEQFTRNKITGQHYLQNALDPKDIINLNNLTVDKKGQQRGIKIYSSCLKQLISKPENANRVKTVMHFSKFCKFNQSRPLFVFNWIDSSEVLCITNITVPFHYGSQVNPNSYVNAVNDKDNYSYTLKHPNMKFCPVHNSILVLSNQDPKTQTDSLKYTYVFKGVHGVTQCYVPAFANAVSLKQLERMKAILVDAKKYNANAAYL